MAKFSLVHMPDGLSRRRKPGEQAAIRSFRSKLSTPLDIVFVAAATPIYIPESDDERHESS
jgi:hypothetical protein